MQNQAKRNTHGECGSWNKAGMKIADKNAQLINYPDSSSLKQWSFFTKPKLLSKMDYYMKVIYWIL